MNRELRRDLVFAVFLVGGMVIMFLLEFVAPMDLRAYGLIPRTGRGLHGIITMPFLHANLSHLTGNLASLIVLLFFLLIFHPSRMISVVVSVIMASGLLLWLFGRPAIHIGASGLIYGLASFLMIAGIIQRRFLVIVGSIAVAFLYGSSLFWGLLPIEPGVSWDGHLAGGIAGIMLGCLFRPERESGRTRLSLDH